MRAKDVMTTDVVTVGPDATVREIASLMCERRISGMPVVKDDRIIGIVSEGDLIRRQEIESVERRQSWWLRLVGTGSSAEDYIKSHATRAADVMTAPPVTVDEDTPLAEIARIFETYHIKRVPVLRDGQLVGLVSRANLVQALAATDGSVAAATSATDKTIRETLTAELKSQSWWRLWSSTAIVSDGVVHFWGFYGNETERDAARVAAENIPGVKAVTDHRTWYGELLPPE